MRHILVVTSCSNERSLTGTSHDATSRRERVTGSTFEVFERLVSLQMSKSTKSVVYVVIDFWCLPDKVQQMKKLLQVVVPEAKKEATCLKFELCENLNEKTQFTFLQAWSTKEALEQHLNSELITKTNDDLRDLLSKPSETRRYGNIG